MDFFGAYTTLLIISLCSILLFLRSSAAEEPSDAAESTGLLLQTIEGKVTIDGAKSEKWLTTTFVSVDGGRYHGFLKANGEFEIHGVVPGSYLVEVVAENYVFEPQRVDISSKSGRVRARKANFLNSKTIDHLPYPLKFRTGNQAEFFEKREPWSIISTLKNPMVLLLVAPMILMLIIPRLMKGMNPEDQKEMQDKMSMLTPGQAAGGMPSIEEYLTNFFGGGSTAAATTVSKKSTSGTRKGKSR